MQKKLIITPAFLVLFFVSTFNMSIQAQPNTYIKRVKVAALNQSEVEQSRKLFSERQDKDKKRKKRHQKKRKTKARTPLFANRSAKNRKHQYKNTYKQRKTFTPNRNTNDVAFEEAEIVKKSAYIFDDNNFENSLRQNDGLVVVDFSASWCAPCIILEPVIDDLAERYKGTALVGKLDIDKSPMIAKTYEVSQLPTILYIKNGKIVHRHIGSASHSQIEAQIKQLL